MTPIILQFLAGLLGLAAAIGLAQWLDHMIAEARRLDLVNDRNAPQP